MDFLHCEKISIFCIVCHIHTCCQQMTLKHEIFDIRLEVISKSRYMRYDHN